MDIIPTIVGLNDTDPSGNVTYVSNVGGGGGRPLSGEVRIPLYSIIFFLAVAGNTLVIVTLAQNRRMRTVTNVFLINLSVSDLLLAVFCMPFTLIPTLLQNFIFGKAMCILIRYMQGKFARKLTSRRVPRLLGRCTCPARMIGALTSMYSQTRFFFMDLDSSQSSQHTMVWTYPNLHHISVIS
jgi:hypothetical protein